MKKVLLGIVGILLFVSCSSDDKKEDTKNNFRFSPEQFKQVGELHNKSLNNAIVFLEDKKGVIDNKEELIDHLYDHYEEQKNDLHVNEQDMFINFLDKRSSLSISSLDINYSSLSKKTNGEGESFEEFNSRVTKKISKYLDELYSILNSGTINGINELEMRASKDKSLNNEDLYVLYNATSVGKSSFEYWKKDEKTWNTIISVKASANLKSLISSTDSKISTRGWGREVLTSDAAGAAAGAMYAWWMNAAVGPGTAAYGATIGATSASSSAYALVKSMFD